MSLKHGNILPQKHSITEISSRWTREQSQTKTNNRIEKDIMQISINKKFNKKNLLWFPFILKCERYQLVLMVVNIHE